MRSASAVALGALPAAVADTRKRAVAQLTPWREAKDPRANGLAAALANFGRSGAEADAGAKAVAA